MPFNDINYQKGFVEGRYVYVEIEIGFFEPKKQICTNFPSTVIHVANKIAKGNSFAIAFSKKRNDIRFKQLISHMNRW